MTEEELERERVCDYRELFTQTEMGLRVLADLEHHCNAVSITNTDDPIALAKLIGRIEIWKWIQQALLDDKYLDKLNEHINQVNKIDDLGEEDE